MRRYSSTNSEGLKPRSSRCEISRRTEESSLSTRFEQGGTDWIIGCGMMYSAVATVQQFQNKDSSSDCLDLEETKLLASEDSELELTERKSKPFILRRYWRSVFETLLILALIITAALPPIYKPTLLQYQRTCGRLLGRWCLDADPSAEYEVQRFKGTFGLKNQYTGWGPKVDAAWDKITDG
jgi:hypothetical protein